MLPLAAAAFAYASYAPFRALVAVGLVGALGQAVLLAVNSSEVGRTWASAVAAVSIGAVCYLVAGTFRVPPLVVVVPALVPLLPGLDIYRGLALLAEGKDGVLQLASATRHGTRPGGWRDPRAVPRSTSQARGSPLGGAARWSSHGGRLPSTHRPATQ